MLVGYVAVTAVLGIALGLVHVGKWDARQVARLRSGPSGATPVRTPRQS